MSARDEWGDLIRVAEIEDQWDAIEGDRASTHARSRLTRSPKTSGGAAPMWADEYPEVWRL